MKPIDWQRFPQRLLIERQEHEERGLFVYHEDIGWWEFVERFTDPRRAQERAKEYAGRGEAVVLVKRQVTMTPWSIVAVMEAVDVT